MSSENETTTTASAEAHPAEADAPAHAVANPAPARNARSWARGVLALLALPVATWLLVRGLLAPVAGPEGVDNITFGSVWGLLLVMLQPLALSFAMRGRVERFALHTPGNVRDETLRVVLFGLIWLVAFALVTTLTLALFWRPAADGFAPQYPLVGLFFFAWGGLWLGIWLGLRYLRVPATAAQVFVGLGGVAWSTSVLWLNPWLERLSDSTTRLDAMGWLIWTSPMYGWVERMLGTDLFRTGAMYHGADGQAAYSIIGDYVGSVPSWPSAAEMLATWLLFGAAATALGLGCASLHRYVWRRKPVVS